MLRTQQYIKLNTGAKEIRQVHVNPGGPGNSQSIRLRLKLTTITITLSIEKNIL